MSERTRTVAYYREKAEDARRSAARAPNVESCARCLTLAADWDRLADEIEKSDTDDAEAMATLSRSIPKA